MYASNNPNFYIQAVDSRLKDRGNDILFKYTLKINLMPMDYNPATAARQRAPKI